MFSTVHRELRYRPNCTKLSNALHERDWGMGNGMSLFNDMFDTRTLTRIIGALTALLIMKAISSYLGFSWMAVLASG